MEPATVASQEGEVVGFYRNTTEGFSLRLPVGWVGHENEDNYPLLSIETQGRTHPAFADVWVYPRTDGAPAESMGITRRLSIPRRSSRTAASFIHYLAQIQRSSLWTSGDSMMERPSPCLRPSSSVARRFSRFT